MTNILDKIILVFDSKKAGFFKAKGRKIIDKLKEVKFDDYKENEHVDEPRHQGYFHKMSNPSHFFDPDTVAAQIDRQNFTRHLYEDLIHIIDEASLKGQHYNVILVGEPKALGEFRHHLTHHGHKKIHVIEEISKDLAGHPVEEVERLVFA